ncbi:hypothetical protein [Corynebacterium lubricantis]|uniref:hypothetical protein n=1 Tax=Corynebacterium lubricantis TaxID=541095 RepID=UPI0003623960|nr:hypothetical protein [Corynebacterium lubricantis]
MAGSNGISGLDEEGNMQERMPRLDNAAKMLLDAMPFIFIAVLTIALALVIAGFIPMEKDTARVLIAGIALITVVFSLRAPRRALLAYWIIYILMALEPSLRSAVSVFGALGIVWVVAYRGYFLLAIGSVLGLSYLGSIEPEKGEWAPFGDVSSLLVVVFFSVSAVTGWRVRDYVEKQSKKQRDLAEIIEREKKAAIKTLHDAVASTITSIILRSEVLAINPEIGPRQREEIREIARDGRVAMADVHELLNYLVSPRENQMSGETINSFQEHISSFSRFVSSHGFEVEHCGNLEDFPSARCSHEFHYVFRELGANIIKYAEPKSVIKLCVAIGGEDVASVTIQNKIARRQSRSFETTHLGLDGLTETLDSTGGYFTSGYKNNDVWTTSMEIRIWGK